MSASPAGFAQATLENERRRAAGYYPICLSVCGLKVLVVGGGAAALSEITRLVDYGALVEVIAPYVMAEIQELAVTYGDAVKILKRSFKEEDAERLRERYYCLVLALDDDSEINREVLEEAGTAGVLASARDRLEQSSFVVPMALKRGHLKIAVSSDGVSGSTERALLRRIEAMLVNDIDRYVLFLTRMEERLTHLAGESLTQIRTGGAASQMCCDRADASQARKRLTESEELYLALCRQNFEEALQIVDQVIVDQVVDQLESQAQENS